MASILQTSKLYLKPNPDPNGQLHDKEENVKVSYLKMWVGDKRLGVFEGFQFATPENEAKLAVVVKKYEEYSAPRENHVMAALKFNERRQADGESFVTLL